MLFCSKTHQTAWEASDLSLPQNRIALHLGNREEFCEEAARHELPWPASSKMERVDRATARRRLGVRKNDFLLLCIGTVYPKKGQMLLLRTVGRLLERFPNLPLRLLLVGFRDEPHRRKVVSALSPMERKAVRNGKLLWVEQSEISIFYRAADAFVVNSQGSGEAFGRVTIEAMAFGLPILAARAGGVQEVVLDGETGLLHPEGENGLENLAANILRLVRDREFAKRLGIAGRLRANECFSAERFLADLERICSSCAPANIAF